MIPRARWRAGLLLLLATFMTQGCKLPSGQMNDQVPVTLSLSRASPVMMPEKDTLEVVVRDAQGRQIADPAIVWAFSGVSVNVVQEEGPRAVLAGTSPGPLYVEARLDDRRFAASNLRDTLEVGYAPLTVSLVGLGPDTVLKVTSRGAFDLEATAVDQYGQEGKGGEFTATTKNRSVRFVAATSGGVALNAFGFGPDTIAVSYSVCPNSCGDTLAVDVEPVPAAIGFSVPLDFYRVGTLGIPFQVPAAVVDSGGYPVPGVPVVFLADPADTAGILTLVDSSSGTYSAQANGQTAIRVSGAGFTGYPPVRVRQQIARIAMLVPSYVVGPGTYPLGFLAWDSGGTAVPLQQDTVHACLDSSSECGVSQAWTIFEPTVATIEYDPGNPTSTRLQTLGYGRADLDLTARQCISFSYSEVGCVRFSGIGLVHIIHQPDSVRAYPQNGSTTLNGIGSTATWLGNIYLPDTTISAVELTWTSLDSAVATVNLHGLVTAVSPGTARIVGSMGATADTSVVTVVGPGP